MASDAYYHITASFERLHAGAKCIYIVCKEQVASEEN